MTLLEKAKRSKFGNRGVSTLNIEHIELAIAWAKGQVSYGQVKEAIDTPNQVYTVIARSLRKAFEEGKIQETV